MLLGLTTLHDCTRCKPRPLHGWQWQRSGSVLQVFFSPFLHRNLFKTTAPLLLLPPGRAAATVLCKRLLPLAEGQWGSYIQFSGWQASKQMEVRCSRKTVLCCARRSCPWPPQGGGPTACRRCDSANPCQGPARGRGEAAGQPNRVVFRLHWPPPLPPRACCRL